MCFSASLLHWIYFRDVKKAQSIFYPLVGLSVYFFFTLFSTEQTAFFTPLSSQTFSFNWVLSGYAIPLFCTLLFFAFRYWSGVEQGTASKGGLGFLLGMFKGMILLNLPRDFKQEGTFRAEPLNVIQTRWLITLKKKDHYVYQVFNLVGGFESNPQKQPIADEVEILKAQLLEPAFAHIYFDRFKNPIVNITFIHENILIEIKELKPLPEFIWVRSMSIIKNSSGQTIETKLERENFN